MNIILDSTTGSAAGCAGHVRDAQPAATAGSAEAHTPPAPRAPRLQLRGVRRAAGPAQRSGMPPAHMHSAINCLACYTTTSRLWLLVSLKHMHHTPVPQHCTLSDPPPHLLVSIGWPLCLEVISKRAL